MGKVCSNPRDRIRQHQQPFAAQIKELINSAITLRGLAAETLNAFLTDTSSVTYYDVARAIFDFNAPYTAWANYGLLWVFCAGFTVLTYIAMVLFEFTSPSTVL